MSLPNHNFVELQHFFDDGKEIKAPAHDVGCVFVDADQHGAVTVQGNVFAENGAHRGSGDRCPHVVVIEVRVSIGSTVFVDCEPYVIAGDCVSAAVVGDDHVVLVDKDINRHRQRAVCYFNRLLLRVAWFWHLFGRDIRHMFEHPEQVPVAFVFHAASFFSHRIPLTGGASHDAIIKNSRSAVVFLQVQTRKQKEEYMTDSRKFVDEADLKSLRVARLILEHGNTQRAKYIWGPPGVGKSTMVREVAQKKGWDPNRKPGDGPQKFFLLDTRAAQLDALDLRGIPTKGQDGYADWQQFKNVLPHPEIHGEEGILFLDELNLADISVQKASYQLILERRLGDYVLGDKVQIVAAGNPPKDVPGLVQKMPKPLANRFMHLEVDPPKSDAQRMDMVRWFYVNNIHPTIIAYLKAKPDAIYDDSNASNELAWASPRTWHALSDEIQNSALGFLDSDGNLTSNPDQLLLLRQIAANSVGEGRAREYVAYTKCFGTIPDGRTILTHGVDEAVKQSGNSLPAAGQADKFYAISTSVVAHLTALYKQPEVIKHFFEFINKVRQTEAEFAMFTMQEACRIDFGKEDGLASSLIASKEFVPFAKDFKGIIPL